MKNLTKEREGILYQTAEKIAERVQAQYLPQDAPLEEQVFLLRQLELLAAEGRKDLLRRLRYQEAEADETPSPIGEAETKVDRTPRKARNRRKTLLDQAGVTRDYSKTALGKALTTLLGADGAENSQKSRQTGPTTTTEKGEEPKRRLPILEGTYTMPDYGQTEMLPKPDA